MFADPALSARTVEDLRGVYVPAYLYSRRRAHRLHRADRRALHRDRDVHDDGRAGQHEDRDAHGHAHRVPAARRARTSATSPTSIVSASRGPRNGELAARRAVRPQADAPLQRRRSSRAGSHEEFSRAADECGKASPAARRVDEVGRAAAPVHARRQLLRPRRGAPTVEWESLDPILVPVWVFAVRYRDDKPAAARRDQRPDRADRRQGAAVVVEDHARDRSSALAVIAAHRPAHRRSSRHERLYALRTPLEEGDLRCAVCALPVPADAHAGRSRPARADPALHRLRRGDRVSTRRSRRRRARSAARR